jgi:hypothetical protein
MHRTPFRAALLLAAALMPASVLASSVYLNGVKIDGVTNQKFEKATVRIDEKGDVLIDAPAYSVRVVSQPAATPAPATPTPPASTPAPATQAPATAPAASAAPSTEDVPERMTRRYWLVTEQSTPGMTDYDIDIYVNSKWIKKLRNNEEQVVSEITRHLQPGKNTVLLSAHKLATGDSRRSASPSNYFKVIVGEGNVGGDNVMIDTPLIRFQRTAADTQDVSEEFTLTTR